MILHRAGSGARGRGAEGAISEAVKSTGQCWLDTLVYPMGSMYAIYGNIYHQYTPNVSIYTIHG